MAIYDLAVKNDPRLHEAEQILYANREAKPQAQALLLPNFSLSASTTYRDESTQGTSTSGSFQRGDRYTYQQAGASVKQSLYDRSRWLGLRKADHQINQAEAQYQAASTDLMIRVTQAYFNVLRAADQVRAFQALVTANERQLEQSKQRFDVGLVAITDVNESQAAYDSSRADLIGGKNALSNAWEALRLIVGPIQLPLARLGSKLPLAPPEPNDIQAWADTAVKNNFNIIAAQEAVEVARQEIEIQRSGHLPSFNLEAGYSLARSDAYFNNDTDQGFVSLNMTVPLYQGGAVASRTRAAGYSLRAAQNRLDQQRRDVINQSKNAFRGILSSISDVQARQAAMVSARSMLESTQAGLDVGTRTQVDVLNAQRNLFNAEFEYLSARYNYIINGIQLHGATSTLTREVLEKGNAWLNPKDLVTSLPD
jgi:outer membrane protein